jgi:hypothetical protein
VQREQLDWLSQQRLELAEQTAVLRQQMQMLAEIRNRLGAVDVVARLTLLPGLSDSSGWSSSPLPTPTSRIG